MSAVRATGGESALGVDVGGTKIAAGLVTPEGRVLAREVIPTLPERGGAQVLADAVALASALRQQAAKLEVNVAALGVGVCELVGLQGEILSGHTVDWRGVPVQEQFAALAPSIVEADSRTAAFAEAAVGAGKPFRTFYYVTVGTGIGGCWVFNGEPFAGVTGCTGTLASSPTRIVCPVCKATREAILEELASGSALVARYRKESGRSVTSAEQVVQAAAAGDDAADWVVRTAAESLGSTLGLIVNLLDPEALIIGGGLGSAPGIFWERLNPAIREHIWSPVHREIPILQASCGGDSGWIGAALLGWKRLRNNQSDHRTPGRVG